VSGKSATDVWIAAGELLHTADGGATFQHADPDPSVRRTNEVRASSTSRRPAYGRPSPSSSSTAATAAGPGRERRS
jgi:hypothetical protein